MKDAVKVDCPAVGEMAQQWRALVTLAGTQVQLPVPAWCPVPSSGLHGYQASHSTYTYKEAKYPYTQNETNIKE